MPSEKPYWHQQIDRAKRRGRFTNKNKNEANSWFSCACGKLDERIPREDGFPGMPLDDALSHLGADFLDVVEEDDFAKAREILIAIEAREAELLRAIAEGQEPSR